MVLTDYFLVGKRRMDLEVLDRVGGEYPYSHGYRRTGVVP
jgi:hypothetical protein